MRTKKTKAQTQKQASTRSRAKATAQPIRPYVLVVNDDGIVAPGIAALICALQDMCDLIVVAPDGPRSGAACSITTTLPVSYRVVSDEPTLKAYACSGTPVDCTKMALEVLCERRPDLLVSGINLGNNATINTYYSGTMGAVIEGTLKGIPSIGFSLDTFDSQQADYSVCAPYIQRIVQHVLDKGLPQYTLLNVNFPLTDKIKGMKVCRMAMGDWQKEYERIATSRPGNHYWMIGTYVLHDKGRDHDMAALASGYVSIVPQRLDMTDHTMFEALSELTQTRRTSKKLPMESKKGTVESKKDAVASKKDTAKRKKDAVAGKKA